MLFLNRCIILICISILPGLLVAQSLPPLPTGKAVLHRDTDGIVHIYAKSERDVIYAQGWAHARDRFFQMDSSRRQASGTLAELLGESVINDDIELRALGLRAAAERSLAAVSAESQQALDWYAEGVNRWLNDNPLPTEYTDLEITTVAPWTASDSLVIAKLLAVGLSLDIDIGLTNSLNDYEVAGDSNGFDGTALFFEDLYRSAPFDPASTVPDAGGVPRSGGTVLQTGETRPRSHWRNFDSSYLKPETLRMAREYQQRIEGLPFFQAALHRRDALTGSNEWGVAGTHTASGRPMIANDPHLMLDTPATFYQNHLSVAAIGLNVIGSSFAGVPYVVIGQNDYITWGATTNPMDVTDVFQETLVSDPNSPAGLSIEVNGELHIMEFILPQFRYNLSDDGIADNTAISSAGPPILYSIPYRNNGPVLSVDFGTFTALSGQYTGLSPTREADTFRLWNYAKNLDDFQTGLQLFDFGSQNWAYADIDGNLAYFTSGELPLREDLQAGAVDGLPPFFIRNGAGGNNWLTAGKLYPGQAVPNAVLPPEEMPQVINPPEGYFVNANNDPIGNTLDNDPLNEIRPGGGIFYMNPGYASGFRAGRIDQALGDALDAGPVTRADMETIQANVSLLDAEYFTPFILAAHAAADEVGADPALAALGANTAITEAITRLQGWQYNFPTGVAEGYDAADLDGVRGTPDAAEIAASVNATIYSVWRGQFIANTIDAALTPFGLSGPGSAQAVTALRNLLDNYAQTGGVGASGLDFFAETAIADADQRLHFKVLSSLGGALDLLAGANFAQAFANSTDQDNYRWGRLHRLVLEHPLGSPYSLPDPQGPLLPSFDDLRGFAVDGGFGAVDASSHSARADSDSEFTFGSGPVRRYVGVPGTVAGSIEGRTILPGGSSGVLGSPWYANLAERWLTNETFPMRQDKAALKPNLAETVSLQTTTPTTD